MTQRRKINVLGKILIPNKYLDSFALFERVFSKLESEVETAVKIKSAFPLNYQKTNLDFY